MASFHLAANLPTSLGTNGAVASLMGGQKEAGQGVFNAVLKTCLDRTGNQTAGTVSLNLFKTILAGQGEGSADGLSRPSLSLKGFLERLEPLASVMSMLKIPPQAVPSLRGMLESLGITAKEVSGLIETARDSQGFVRLDRLWVRLKEKAALPDSGQETPSIPPSQLPIVAQMLSAMGMESDRVKALIEKATDGDGSLDSQVLLRAVKAHSEEPATASSAGKAAASFSRALGMLYAPTENGLLAREPQLTALVHRMAEDPSLAQQERIKQDISALLQQKGIPPQDVKAFLENLTVSQAKDLLKAVQASGAKGSSEAVSALMGQVKVDAEKPGVSGADPRTIMDILSKDSRGLKDSTEKKVAATSLSSGSRPGAGTNQAEANGANLTAKKSDHNASPSGNPSAAEASTNVTGETIHAGGKTVFFGGGVELTTATGSKSGPQPSPESALRAPVVLPEPLPKILDRMVWMVQGGVQKTTVELSPPELGRIQLKLVIENGQIRGVMGTENPMVKELIDANLNQLRAQLEGLGFSVQSFEVMAGLDQHQRPDHDSAWHYDPQSTGAGALKDGKSMGHEAKGSNYDGRSSDGHQINLRV